MKRNVIWAALAISGIAVAIAGGYWMGLKQAAHPSASSAPIERQILYYRHPMGLSDTSLESKKDSMGMDYIPVYADEAGGSSTAANGSQAERKVLYYRHPMGLPDSSSVPKQDSMGMDYIPVYEDDEMQSGQVKISPDKVQKLGVKTAPAEMREMVSTVRAVGKFQVDERRLHTVTTKFEGYIEKLYVNATSQPVKRGQPLMQVYSPELVSAQEEYLIAWQGSRTLEKGTQESQIGVGNLAEGALKRLRNWDVSDAQLQRLQKEGKATRTMTLYSPVNGVVLEKSAVQGMRFMPGEPLYQIADLSQLWMIADVFEQDIAMVRVGQKANIIIDAYPGREFSGKVAYVYPTLSPETRTVQVRVELANPDGVLKPDMYASVQLASGQGKAKMLAVPDSAIIDSGTRQVVLVQRGEGLFEPREVKLGMRADGYTEILAGVSLGDDVVVRANFLIDAESNLKAALGSFDVLGEKNSAKPEMTAPASMPINKHEGH